jgi:nucleoside-diphosphate-sugar epimerase
MDGLIGHTGFVGGNLAAQHRFGAWFNSKNIEAIRGQRFDLLVVSGLPAAKWIANRDPLGDRANFNRLWNCLVDCRADRLVIMSTVDVYPAPFGVDEDTLIEHTHLGAYGRNRLELERRASLHFPRVLPVRLPGLFGPGLKKNAIFDLMHHNDTQKIPSDGEFQFYNLNRLWKDIQASLDANLRLVNLATEPVTVRDVASHAFGMDFSNRLSGLPPKYDMRTKHAELFGGKNGYLESREQVLTGIKAFVQSERRTMRAAA